MACVWQRVDPLVVVLLVVFVGLPVLSLVLLAAFAVSADFEFEDIQVRGGQLRGAVAAAVAKIVVGDAKTFQLPLVLRLRKTGLAGASTPILGGVTVRDLEWRLMLDGEHAATITEAHSVRIAGAARVIELPVTAEIHPPGGLLRSLRRLRKTRRDAAETRLDVRGHVIVKHWWMTRAVPVRVTRYVVLGEPVPELERLEWRPVLAEGNPAPERATLALTVANPYREEPLAGRLVMEIVRPRRLRRDAVVGRVEEEVTIRPGRRLVRNWQVSLERSRSQKPLDGKRMAEGIAVGARVRWDGERLKLAAADASETDDAGAGESSAPVPMRLRPRGVTPRGMDDDEPRVVLAPVGADDTRV